MSLVEVGMYVQVDGVERKLTVHEARKMYLQLKAFLNMYDSNMGIWNQHDTEQLTDVEVSAPRVVSRA